MDKRLTDLIGFSAEKLDVDNILERTFNFVQSNDIYMKNLYVI